MLPRETGTESSSLMILLPLLFFGDGDDEFSLNLSGVTTGGFLDLDSDNDDNDDV